MELDALLSRCNSAPSLQSFVFNGFGDAAGGILVYPEIHGQNRNRVGCHGLRRAKSSTLFADSSEQRRSRRSRDMAMATKAHESEKASEALMAGFPLLKESVVLQEMTEHFMRMESQSHVGDARGWVTAKLPAAERNQREYSIRVNPPIAEKEGGEEEEVEDDNEEEEMIRMPISLRRLKRKISRNASGSGESFRKAFSSLVSMMKALHSHTLRMRELLFFEDLTEMADAVQTEMNSSFIWLFQQVFACTPKLMLLTMLLIADFTVHSMENGFALLELHPSAMTAVLSDALNSGTSDKTVFPSSACLKEAARATQNGRSSGGSGIKGGKGIGVTGGSDLESLFDNASHSPAFYLNQNEALMEAIAMQYIHSEGSSIEAPVMSADNGKLCSIQGGGQFDLLLARQKVVSDLRHNLVSDAQLRMQSLVAPITVEIEPDNYLCYDRTELLYQNGLSTDPDNPLLLANYAQFLYLVRHDIKRAEEYFWRALKADPLDGEVYGRFGTFLWVACGDRLAAEEAFQVALASDPTNPFHAGSYAHILWHYGEAEIPDMTKHPHD